MADKVGNWRLNRRKLGLEIEKLESEVRTQRYEEETARARFETAIKKRNAAEILGQIAHRLEANPIKVADVEFQRLEDK